MRFLHCAATVPVPYGTGEKSENLFKVILCLASKRIKFRII